MADKVSVTAIKYHTNNGKAYEAGDTYDVDPGDVDNLQANGMAKLSHVYDEEKKVAASHPVEPMTTDTFGKA